MAEENNAEQQFPVAHPVKYPPRNRPTNDLDFSDIHIVQQHEVHYLDPNKAIMFILDGATGLNSPIEGCTSDISGEPAYIYRTDDVELRLTGDELARLITRSLTPDEFFKLAERYGIFHEIHCDFYNENTGEIA